MTHSFTTSARWPTTFALLAATSLMLVACDRGTSSLAQNPESIATTPQPTPAPAPTPAPTPAPPETTPTPPVATQATLAWDAPDSASLAASGVTIKGYRVYAGTSASTLVPVATVENAETVSHVVANLAKGTWYFAVSSITTDGRESELTAPAVKSI